MLFISILMLGLLGFTLQEDVSIKYVFPTTEHTVSVHTSGPWSSLEGGTFTLEGVQGDLNSSVDNGANTTYRLIFNDSNVFEG